MYKLEHLDFSKLKLAKSNLENEHLMIYGVKYPAPNRSLKLYMHGNIAASPHRMPEDMGGHLVFKFRPSVGDLPNLIKLEELVSNPPDDGNIKEYLDFEQLDPIGWDFKSTLDDDNYLNIKLKTDDEGKFKFYSNEELNPDNLDKTFKQAARITIAVNPGFYFGDKYYGMFFTLKDLIFDDKPEPKQTETVKKFLKRNAYGDIKRSHARPKATSQQA